LNCWKTLYRAISSQAILKNVPINPKLKLSGRRYLTAYGYKWEYENNIEGSTTIEKTLNSGTE
jgi:hypothetical protein